MREYRFSAVSIAQHELFRALRRAHNLGIHKDVFERILAQRDSVKKAFSITLISSVLLVMWVASSPLKSLNIKIQSLEVEFEKIYILFAACLNISLVYMMLFSFLFLNQTILKFIKIKHGGASEYVKILYEGENAWSLSFLVKFNFLLSGKAHSIFSMVGFFLYIIPLLISLFVMYIVLLMQILFNIKEYNIFSFKFLISISSFGFLLFCFVLFILFIHFFRIVSEETLIISDGFGCINYSVNLEKSHIVYVDG